MKSAKTLLSALLLTAGTAVNAANVDEIISGYHELIGGEDALREMKAMKMTAELSQGPMTFPLEIVQTATGHKYTKATVQGQVIYQDVFDGETLWGTNFMTMKAEKSQAEQTANAKLDINDFPDSLIDWKEKGYTAELMGTESVDGEDAYKIKLTKEPIMLEGQETPNVSYYYFDSEAMILVMTESEMKSGPMKGQIMQIKMSDYQEVDGLYFPFSLTQGVKGQPSSPMTIKSIELNPTIDESVFVFPAAQ